MLDLHAIAKGAVNECIRQQTEDIISVSRLLNAYGYAQEVRVLDPFQIVALGQLVEPVVNAPPTYRRYPVTFKNGGSSANYSDIPRCLNTLLSAEYDEVDTDEWIKQFLWIHPFRDGNGRVAWILQNYLNHTLDSPEPLVNHFGE